MEGTAGVIVTHDRVVCFCPVVGDSIALKCAGRAFGRYWSQEGKERRGISQEEARGVIELFCYLCLQLTFLLACSLLCLICFPIPTFGVQSPLEACEFTLCLRQAREKNKLDRQMQQKEMEETLRFLFWFQCCYHSLATCVSGKKCNRSGPHLQCSQ